MGYLVLSLKRGVGPTGTLVPPTPGHPISCHLTWLLLPLGLEVLRLQVQRGLDCPPGYTLHSPSCWSCVLSSDASAQ